MSDQNMSKKTTPRKKRRVLAPSQKYEMWVAMLTGQGTRTLPEPVVELFGWHAAHQRLDAWRTLRWPDTGRVFVNAYGAPINAQQADATVAYHCTKAGLPVVPLAGLRHPSWCGA